MGTARLSILLILAAGLLFPLTASGREGRSSRNFRLKPLAVPARPGIAADSSSRRGPGFPCVLTTRASGVPRLGRIRPISDFISESRSRPAPADGRGRLTPREAGGAMLGRVDTLKVAFLRCDFVDRLNPDSTTGDGKFIMADTAYRPVDPPPHDRTYFEKHGEALRRYYHVQSQGHLEIEPHVFPVEPDSAFHLGDMASYGPWKVSASDANIPIRAERLIKDAFEAAHRSGEVDFSRYDAFIVVHAGADFQSDINNDTPYDIPTFVLQFGDSVVVDGKRIDRAMVLPETNTQDGRFAALNGTLAHEFGHILGLYDLYNTLTGVPVVGRWSLMDSGENIPAIMVVDPSDTNGVEVAGAVPTSLDAWSRLQLFGSREGLGGGFLLDHFHVAGESLAVRLAAAGEEADIAYAEISDQEYYLVENRETDLDGNGYPIIRADKQTGVILGPEVDSTLASREGALEYDALLPGSGLVVWHIDQRVLPGGDLASGYGVNVHPDRRAVKVVEADGIDDLEWRTTGNYGTPWDPFYAGNNSLFGPATIPPSVSNDGQASNITMETSSAPGTVMDLTVLRRSAVDGWPIGLIPEITGDHVNALDVTGDHSPEMLFAIDKSIFALEGRGAKPFPPISSAQPGLVPLLKFNARLDHRIATAGAFPDPSGSATSLIAVQAPNQGKIVLWNAAGAHLGDLDGALSAPAIGKDFIAYANASGGVDLAGLSGGVPLRFYTSPPHFDRDPAGNVIAGDLAGAGTIEAAVSMTDGRVHLYSTANATAQEAGPPQLSETGNSPVLGASPLQLLAANFGGPAAPYQVASLDPNGRAAVIDLAGNLEPGWPVNLPAPIVGFPAAADIDRDGSAELVVADTLGALRVMNGDGSPAFGFPVMLGSKPTTGPLVADLDGRAGPEIIVMTEDGSLRAYGAGGKPVAGFPVAMGGRTLTTAMLVDLNADGRLDVAGMRPTLPFAASLGRVIPDSAVVWGGEQNGSGRNAVLDRRFATGGPALLAGRLDELVCYPNPAHGDVMHVRLFLSQGQSAKADVFDMLGRAVADLPAPAGGAGEADIAWNLSGIAPGVYLVRVTRTGQPAPDVRWRTVSVIH